MMGEREGGMMGGKEGGREGVRGDRREVYVWVVKMEEEKIEKGKRRGKEGGMERGKILGE